MTQSSPISDTISAEPSEILKADPYLMQIWRQGYLSLKEAERRALVSGLLKERYSSTPFYRRKAEADPDYWSKFSGRVANGFAGADLQGTLYSLDRGNGARRQRIRRPVTVAFPVASADPSAGSKECVCFLLSSRRSSTAPWIEARQSSSRGRVLRDRSPRDAGRQSLRHEPDLRDARGNSP